MIIFYTNFPFNSAAHGQFLKYGTLSWRQTGSNSTGITVQFILQTAWRREFFSRTPIMEPYGSCTICTGSGRTATECGTADVPCTLPLVGDTVEIYDYLATSTASLPPVPTTFTFGGNPDDILTGQRDPTTIPRYTPFCRRGSDNGRKCIRGRVVEAFANTTAMPTPEDDASATVYVVTELTYVYPPISRTYVAGFQGCCRAPSGERFLNNNAGGAWDIKAFVSVTTNIATMQTGTAASPFFAHTPTVLVIKGRPLQFPVAAYDIAERPITYAIGTLDEHGVGVNQISQPPYGNVMGITINPVTGVVFFPATASTVYERYYSLVVTATVPGPCARFDSSAAIPVCLDEM
jgi:hypothetical protein